MNYIRSRACLTALVLAFLVVSRTEFAPVATVLTVVGVVAARCLAGRAAIAALGILVVFGVPWIVTAFISGLVWFLLKNRHESWGWVRSSALRIRGVAGLAAVGIGMMLGLVAVPFVRDQASLTPIVFDIVKPSVAIVLVTLFILALANSIGEELLWRGALEREAYCLPVAAQYLLQGLSFGLAHWHGLPGGLVGCLLAGTASFVFLWLHRKWGILASIIGHLVADIVIFVAILPQVLFVGWAVAS